MDELDRRLRVLAGESLDRVADAVPVDDHLALVRGRAADRSVVATERSRSWMRLGVAATLVLLIGGAVTALAMRDGGEEVVAPVDALGGAAASTPPAGQPTASPPTTIGPVATQVAPPAVAEPSTVDVGWTVSITPSAEVVRTCQNIVSVLLRTDHESVPVGLITPTGWDTRTSSTIPACRGERTSDALRVTVPGLELGEYWFCIAGDDTPEGCARVTVASAPTTSASTIATTTITTTTNTTTTNTTTTNTTTTGTGTATGTQPIG